MQSVNQMLKEMFPVLLLFYCFIIIRVVIHIHLYSKTLFIVFPLYSNFPFRVIFHAPCLKIIK